MQKPLPLGATATTAASGGNREELLGQRPAGCERQRSRRWEPQPGLGERSDDGEGKPVSREPPCSDKLALWQSDAIAAPIPLRQRPCPLRRSAPALPKGEPLAGRATSYWTPEARYDAKGRALLQRAAASGQYPLSSCRESRQRSTPVPETSCFACPGEI